MVKYKTDQEQFWAGNFGNNYIERNNSSTIVSANMRLFGEIFSKTYNVETVMELGANIGLNIEAINSLLPNSKTHAVEINEIAYRRLQKICTGQASLSTIINFDKEESTLYDFVFTKGVLIHINPNLLDSVYDTIYKLSKRYICIAEYYNQTPVGIEYRGEKDRLYKRDFAGEMLDRFSNLKLLDYGFCYHRDNCFPLDDITWFLMEKKGNID